jgi:uncharacterized protein YndB with AHSA1/START domain
MHMQQRVAAPSSAVFHALTDEGALTTWFAEHASISRAEHRYDFWGRFTPEAPDRNGGRHEIELWEPDRRLRFQWLLRGAMTTVDVRLTERDGDTIVGVWHHDIPSVPRGEPGCYSMDDVWFLWLENLRRYVEHRPVVRCDFTLMSASAVEHVVNIEGSPADVWTSLLDPTQLNRWIASHAAVDPMVGGEWNMGWGDEGAFRILELEPQRKLALEWEIDGTPTVVTWTLDDVGGKVRLTLSHSGFADGYRCDGEQAGWLNFLIFLGSLVEYGKDWLPPIKELATGVALLYASKIWQQQEELLSDADDEWT